MQRNLTANRDDRARYFVQAMLTPACYPVLVLTDRLSQELLPARSVTNDASDVIRDLVRERGPLGRTRVIYQDSEGWLDGLGHDGEQFTGFYPIRARSLEDALAALPFAETSRPGYWPGGSDDAR